ncbi:putative toxin-antitoxin system toxin component, PIN family, partial [Phascolarctobacterium sp.]|uniref:putative toxin-antitoxin system toxin component, PIN family n=1 Tax=Phascolarctobacterium sp. TaxID=2049039 RepID=UPI00386F57F5
MSYYAVIDTNVLVSAMLKSVSMPGKIILEVLSGCIVPLYNTEIISEYREVLARKKFKFDPSMVNVLINTIIQRGVSVD